MTAKKVLIVLAEGAEEMEAVIAIDVLRRAKLQVIVAGLEGVTPVRCSRGVVITPDAGLASLTDDFDALVLPGGAQGAQRLAASPAVGDLLRAHERAKRWVAAICAAPIALKAHSVFRERRMTSHPSVRAELESWATYSTRSVVEDGTLITSQGPGTAFAFALRLVGALTNAETMAAVRAPMMFPVQVS
ncbi:MAG: DJ-1 family glyoxalase III [Polyangiales bacterium]